MVRGSREEERVKESVRESETDKEIVRDLFFEVE